MLLLEFQEKIMDWTPNTSKERLESITKFNIRPYELQCNFFVNPLSKYSNLYFSVSEKALIGALDEKKVGEKKLSVSII